MNRDKRSLLKQMKASKNSMGSLFIMFLMIMAIFATTMIILSPNPATASAVDYAYYKELTIESDYINGVDLTNFPILVHDNTGDLLGDVESDGNDIAFFDSTNTTQYNHEIEEYNSTTGELIAWVNITSLSHQTDTTINMFYGDSDGGYSVGYNPTEVWDSNFTGVYHMNASTTTTSGCYDSTAGANHGTFNGNMPTNVDGWIGGGQYGADDPDYIELPSGVNCPQDVTVTMLYKSDGLGDNKQVIWHQREDATEYRYFSASGINTHEFNCAEGGSPEAYIDGGTRNTYWTHWAGSAHATNNATLYINASNIGVDTEYQITQHSYGNIYLGLQGSAGHLYGTIDEVRISNTRRSNVWLTTSYYATGGANDFVTFGSETESGSATVVNFNLDNDLFTFQAEQGETIWANESASIYETGEFNISYNESGDGVEYIRINYTEDFHANITNSKISVQFNIQNSSWNSNVLTLEDGANTIWLNSSVWDAQSYCIGADPFPIQEDTSLWMRTKVAIPTGIGNETYSNSDFITWDAGYYS